jgi:hypothetical protein
LGRHHCLTVELVILRLELIKTIHWRHWLPHLVGKTSLHRIEHHRLWSDLIWEELLLELLGLLCLDI